MSDKKAPEVRGGSSSEEIRRARVRRLTRRLLIWVALPTLLGVLYYSLIVASQYESVALFTVQSNKNGKASALKKDAMIVKEFVLSRTMLERLSAEHGFAEHYSGSLADFLSGVSSDASDEELYEYYRKKVSLEYQGDSGSLRLRVLAFSGKAAQEFAQAILNLSEEMTNSVADRARADRLHYAEELAQKAEQELDAIELEYQRLNADAARASAASPAEAAKPSAASPPEAEASATGGPGVPQIDAREALRFKLDLARKRFESARSDLESTRRTLAEERLFVETISAPSAPGAAAYPRRLWSIASVFFLSLVLMAVMTMLAAAVREHGRF